MSDIISMLALFDLGFICGAGVILFLRKKTSPPFFEDDNDDS